jgi:hypothetical protein
MRSNQEQEDPLRNRSRWLRGPICASAQKDGNHHGYSRILPCMSIERGASSAEAG